MTMLTVEGIRKPITEWAADYGIPVRLIQSRLRRGWSEQRAVEEPMVVWRGEKLPADALLEAPPKPKPKPAATFDTWMLRPRPTPDAKVFRQPFSKRPAKLITFRGVSLSAREWAEHLGISPQAMHQRLKTKPLEEAFRLPRPGWTH